jgi:hypothetical protein
MRERGEYGSGWADFAVDGEEADRRSFNVSKRGGGICWKCTNEEVTKNNCFVLFCVLLNGVTVSPCRRVALADIKVSVRPGLN